MSETHPAPAQARRAELLIELFTHFDRMMWQAPIQYLSVAALVLGAGAWVTANLESVLPARDAHAGALFGASLGFAGLVLLLGANHMGNSRRHRNLVRAELRAVSGLDYFAAARSFWRISASRAAVLLMALTGLAMIAGGALLGLQALR